MKLIDVIARLKEFDPDKTIYAAEPWTPESEVQIEHEPQEENLLRNSTGNVLAYFLEIFIAVEFSEDWVALNPEISNLALCERLIQYAINDA